jgi:hypothetical protein
LKTIHVAGIRGLRGQPGIASGEEITEDDLAAFFGNDGEVTPRHAFRSPCLPSRLIVVYLCTLAASDPRDPTPPLSW